MTLDLCGVAFAIRATGGLLAAEEALLRQFPAAPVPSSVSFEIAIEPGEPAKATSQEPPSVRVVGDFIRMEHHSFSAVIDPLGRKASVTRHSSAQFPLYAVLRIALGAALPQIGGAVMHAGAVLVDGNAYVFFGPSGAGKSTTASSSPYPVLSDENVAIVRRDGALAAMSTGFWGTADDLATATTDVAPIRALLALGRGESFDLRRLDPREAFERLIPAMLVQPVGALWTPTLSLLGALSRLDVFEMRWNGREAPWDALLQAVPPHS